MGNDNILTISQNERIKVRELYLEEGKTAVRTFLEGNGKLFLYEQIMSQLILDIDEQPIEYLPPNKFSMYEHYISSKKFEQRKKLGEDVKAIHKRLHTRRLFVDLQKDNDLRHYGLVIGKVQSGKTANMLGLTALSLDSNLDNSYKFSNFDNELEFFPTKIVIILSGLIDDLRIQTYNRFLNDFKGFDLANYIHGPASNEDDLTKDILFQNKIVDYLRNARNSFEEPEKKLIIIVKKNYRVLDKITELIQRSFDESDQEQFVGSWLIIDDECDYASQDKNFAGNNNTVGETATNESLRRMIKLSRDTSDGQVWYVGYTATPFSNLLANPHVSSLELGPDLFPSGFISIIEPPDAHFDNGFYFNSSEGENHLIIDDKVSFEDRLNQFVILHCLTRLIKQHRRLDVHHTSMVHAVRLKQGHVETLREIANIISLHKSNINSFRKELESELACFDNLESSEIDLITGIIRNSENNFMGDLLDIELIELNRRTKELEPEYEESSGEKEFADELVYGESLRNIIVTGGDRISRGLTLEGLTTSLFFRTAQQPSYDTMLQMARWNGYREDYSDIVRIITTNDIEENYQKIAIAEEDMRTQMRRYNDHSDPVIEIIELLKFNGLKLTGSLPSREFLNIMNVINDNYQSDKIYVTHPPELVDEDSTYLLVNEFIDDLETIFEFESPPKIEDLGKYMVSFGIDSNHVKEFIQGYIQCYNSANIPCKKELENIITNFDNHIDWNVAFALSPTKQHIITLESGYSIGLSERTPKLSRGFDPVYSNYPIASQIDLEKRQLRDSPLLLIYFLYSNSVVSKKITQPIPLLMLLRPNHEGIGGSIAQRWSGHRAGHITTISMLKEGESNE